MLSVLLPSDDSQGASRSQTPMDESAPAEIKLSRHLDKF